MSDRRKPLDPVADAAEALHLIASRMPSDEALRTDHPLQGETFGGIADALNNVASAIAGNNDALYQIARALAKMPVTVPV